MKIDRRNFLKLGAVSGGALALPDPLKLAEKNRKPWNRQQARTLRKFRNPMPTTCGLCENRCGLISYREGDRIVMLHGNPAHPLNEGKLCARAYGQLDRLYDPDRILQPKVRDGERGSGKWRNVSWAEAYRLIAEKLTPYKAAGGSGVALLLGRSELMEERLLELFPQALAVEDLPAQALKKLRLQLYGVSGCHRDFAGSRFILNFAADPYIRGSQMLTDMRQLIAGRVKNGARLVTVSGRLNNTGGRSDLWLPVAPADYGTLARSLAYCLLESGLYDARSLSRQRLKVDELKALLKSYQPSLVADRIGLQDGQITDLAREMACKTPAMAIYDEELLSSHDGWHSAAAVELLNVLLGSLGRPGGLYYYSEEDGLGSSLGRCAGQRERERVSLDWFADWLQGKGNRPAVLSYACNPAFTTFSGPYSHALWRNPYKVPFHLAIDTHLTETSVFADIILPAATELEGWGVADMPLADGHRVLSLRQPVSQLVDEILLLRQAKANNLDLFATRRQPVGEARDFNQIVLELEKVLAGESENAAPRFKAWLEEQFSAPQFAAAGIDWHKLQASGFQCYQDKFETADLKPSLTISKFAPFAKPLEISAEDNFTLIPYRWHELDNLTANSKYLSELRHDNPLWIHPRRAFSLGISEGDLVQVKTEAGTLEVRAWLSEAIHPSCVAIALGLGHTEMGKVAKARAIADSDPMTRSLLIHNPIHFTPFSFRLRSWDKVEPIWWQEKGNGVDIRRIFKSDRDRENSGMTTLDTTVRLKKV
ncbi:MAG: molybdopterin-dependent oxidoreductase [Deltaproteobacteria bacterium]|nr:molybdopterin-dependent oxidoreductase [Deltaproteobacteria bacterium]